MNAGLLLDKLPPYSNREQIITGNQGVVDIIKEVLNAHEVFLGDYDAIAVDFRRSSVEKTCKALFDFCKRNIVYEIETYEDQTTRSPAAIIEIGCGDCKHYAGFIAGVLDALKRNGEKIEWNYRFASYDLFNKTPGHVFVVVKDKGREIWVDPVLEQFNERLEPAYITDKRVSGMLTRISGIDFTDDPVDYPVSAYLNNAGNNARGSNVDQDVQTLLKYGVMNVDMSLNEDLLPVLEQTLPVSEYAKIIQAWGGVENAAISGLGENLVHALAKVSLFIPRNAYLSLVGLNVFGLAYKLWNAIYTDDTGTKYYQPGQDKIYHAWYLAGGDWDKLLNTVRHGKANKPILGVAPAIPVWVASATVIIAALGAAISQVLKAKGEQTGINYNLDPSTGLPFGTGASSFPSYSGESGIVSFVKNNPLIVLAAGVGAYFLIKPKLGKRKRA